MPYYAEECASMLAVTFSSGGYKTRNIVGSLNLYRDKSIFPFAFYLKFCNLYMFEYVINSGEVWFLYL